MNVLLTNDDGIHAPGLMALYRELRRDFNVTVVAPETEMTAVGHAISLASPLRVQDVYKGDSFFGYAVTGTPADCVKIATKELLGSAPDILLSGINRGANVGVNILYSGTVSAATEGAFMGIPSAAISMNTRKDGDYGFAARFSREIIRFIRKMDLKRGSALNVNIPDLPPDKIAGVCFTRQGTARFEDSYEQREDPRGHIYYWLSGEKIIENGNPDNDYMALNEGMITITPIHYDLTCKKELERFRESNSISWNIK